VGEATNKRWARPPASTSRSPVPRRCWRRCSRAWGGQLATSEVYRPCWHLSRLGGDPEVVASLSSCENATSNWGLSRRRMMPRSTTPGRFLALALLALAPAPATADDCASDCMLQAVEAYFGALDEVSRRGSGVDDVDSLLELLDENVRYVHVEYEADFSRSEWRDAFVRNLQRGAYANGPQDETRILRSIPGKRHLAVEYSHGVVRNGVWEAGDSYLALFEFAEGRISLVKELW
jgi:hypothetical protein